jgi:hypothetical protein
VLGAYVGRIYEEVQRRPMYRVAREVDDDVPEEEDFPRGRR